MRGPLACHIPPAIYIRAIHSDLGRPSRCYACGHTEPYEMEGIMVSFRGRVRRWRDDKPGGLSVIDIPGELVAELGGRKQMRKTGALNGVPFTGSTMLVAGGGFCVGVSKAAMKSAQLAVGEEVDVQLERA